MNRREFFVSWLDHWRQGLSRLAGGARPAAGVVNGATATQDVQVALPEGVSFGANSLRSEGVLAWDWAPEPAGWLVKVTRLPESMGGASTLSIVKHIKTVDGTQWRHSPESSWLTPLEGWSHETGVRSQVCALPWGSFSVSVWSESRSCLFEVFPEARVVRSRWEGLGGGPLLVSVAARRGFSVLAYILNGKSLVKFRSNHHYSPVNVGRNPWHAQKILGEGGFWRLNDEKNSWVRLAAKTKS